MSRMPEGVKEYYCREYNADENLAKKAYEERKGSGSASDIFEPHFLSEQVLTAFRQILMPIIKEVDEIYLVRRKVKYIPEDPLWVVVAKSSVPWYKVCLHNPKQLIGNYLFEKLNGFFETGSYYVSVDFTVYINKARKIPGSLICENTQR